MKKFTCVIISILCFQAAYAQTPLVKQWDYRFGGMDRDYIYTFQQTTDGGYILGGFSSSLIGGDKTQDTWGGYDFWIVKTDSLGIKQWDKNFGGVEDERLYSLQQTSDGGYILGGTSSSGVSGDKSGPNWDSINFSHDYWIVKIDSLGNKQWDKDFGGTEDDFVSSIQQTTDGGYILGGSSYSSIGGDKTEPNRDTIGFTHDFWIVKTDSLGNKQWDKDLGGTGDDELTNIAQTNDGGYVMAGLTLSGIGGDKTQACKGQIDYWILKIDSLGTKQWDYDFGGTETDLLSSMQYTNDGGCVLAGTSNSGVSGDKTQPNWDITNSTYDFWVVKINSLGIKQWDKVIGGTSSEPRLGNISQTHDNGYLVAGISYSSISGNKTEDNLGIEQTWIVKTDSIGTVQWDKTILTTAEDESGYAIQTADRCYLVANSTAAAPGGDKTEPCQGFEDYWMIKLCDTTSTAGINPISNFQFPVSIYPNPFVSEFTIAFNKQNVGNVTVTIYDVLGKAVFTINKNKISNTYSETIDMSFAPAGIYFLETIIDGERIVKKIVKE